MTRHTVEHRQYWITFGWDHPLMTLFGQVEDSNSECPSDLIELGGPMDRSYTDITKFHKAFKQKLTEIGINDFELSQQQLLHLLSDKDGISLY